MSNAVDVTPTRHSPVWSLRVVPAGGVLEAEHLCTSRRGVQVVGSCTVTSSRHGMTRDDARSRAEFLDLTGVRP